MIDRSSRKSGCTCFSVACQLNEFHNPNYSCNVSDVSLMNLQSTAELDLDHQTSAKPSAHIQNKHDLKGPYTIFAMY